MILVCALGFAAVVAGFLATGEARAQTDMSERQMLNHGNTLAMFERSCIKTAPEFETAFASFAAGGLERTESGLWFDDKNGIMAGIGPAMSGPGKNCSVALAFGSFEFFVEKLREVLARHWEGVDIMDSPPDGANRIHLFLNFSDPSGTVRVVAVDASKGGFIDLIFQVNIPTFVQ